MIRVIRDASVAILRQRTMLVTLMAVAFSIAGTASAQSVLRCESSDGRRQVCRFEGVGTMQMSRQLSDQACIEGQSWGVQGNTIWVDRGCRADFAFVTTDDRNRDGSNMRGDHDGDHRGHRDHAITIVCESTDGRRHRCATDTLGQVSISRQLSRTSRCIEGRSWGSDRRGIWVDRGCRAEFVIADTSGSYRDRDANETMRTVVCESDSSRRTYCRADTRFGVQLMREMSRSNCVLNRTWGSDDNGIWVSNGCRAEFGLRARR